MGPALNGERVIEDIATSFIKYYSSLPPAVIYSLLNSLIITYPLSSSCSLSTVAPITTTAHILYHLWIIRFISQCHTLSSKGLRWDGTCANIETIKQLV